MVKEGLLSTLCILRVGVESNLNSCKLDNFLKACLSELAEFGYLTPFPFRAVVYHDE